MRGGTEVPAQVKPKNLATLQAEAAPLRERLAKVEAAIATLGQPEHEQGGSLDEQIKARQAAAMKVSDLTVEREVIRGHLEPMEAEIAKLEEIEKAERLAADRQRSIDMGRDALGRVAKAREALEAEIAALGDAGKTAPVRWNTIPEFHFEVHAEAAKLASLAHLLGGAVD